ncbi:DUF5675 family protein [Flavihumibacter profundi]|uniref:DUF5675 family protein n=1 Tax=Flavihumibacter profundi TaxID=2716883 RepID=UPI001CC46255|nr:DUF5675 family protein [Flavihumibacter profundi]MBZ5857588.1 DUF5675 family protein [Flavihumibacter profundi]
MELLLEREYYPLGTDGILSSGGIFLCFTIELPWRKNQRNISCIPEGRYPLAIRFSKRHRMHLQVMNVPERSLILIHKANNALKELAGCIAPVRESVSPGIGKDSVTAFKALMKTVCESMENEEEVWLRISRLSDRYGHTT